MRAIEEIGAGRWDQPQQHRRSARSHRRRRHRQWLFTLACRSGCCCIGRTLRGPTSAFGGDHIRERGARCHSAPPPGAVQRKCLPANHSARRLLAGLIGALAVRVTDELVTEPCGGLPLHDPGARASLLNGALDLVKGRIHLGSARLIYEGLVIVAISTGLLLGLALLWFSLPVDPSGRAVPLWPGHHRRLRRRCVLQSVFSTPLHMLAWPVAVGMLAHALRWLSITVVGSSAAIERW